MAGQRLRPCSHPGCPALISGRMHRCGQHTVHVERQRGSAASRGYDRSWQRASKAYLREHAFCVECQRRGAFEAATVVDHIIPHRGDPTLFWDQSNWQGLCKTHHDRKTATQDGGFGNPFRR